MLPEFNTTGALTQWMISQNPPMMPKAVHEMDEFTHIWIIGPWHERYLVYEAS